MKNNSDNNRLPFSGTVITSGITAEQLLDAIELKIIEVLEKAGITPGPEPLAEWIDAAQTCEILRYKTKRSLLQWHGMFLNPQRRGRKNYYKSTEVTKLKKILFGKK